MVQEPVPEQAPNQPVKSELASGFAVSVTDVPLANFALHAKPQLIPDGLLVTVPPPVPAFWTVISIDNGGAHRSLGVNRNRRGKSRGGQQKEGAKLLPLESYKRPVNRLHFR